MKKVLLISHIADMDGLGCVILGKIVFPKMDIILIEPDELKEKIEDILKTKKYSKYEKIFITDLGMNINVGKLIDDSPMKKIITHLDHHQSNMEVSIYPWSTVISEVDGFKPSGTSLFYEYLLNNYSDNEVLKNNSLKELVEGIRSNDTYQFIETGNKLGYYLTQILARNGKEKVIDDFYDRIIHGDKRHFKLTDEEVNICTEMQKELDDYLKWCDDTLIRIKFMGYNVGLSISTKFRSSVGNLLSEKYKDELDFILIANYERESFLVRTVNEINVGNICKKLGGGGHEKAGGFPMTDENLKLTSPYFDKNKLETLKKEVF